MRKYWWKFFLAIFPLMVIWAVTNPMFASPDEPAHMVRAQGIVRGQMEGPYKVDGLPVDAVSCLAFKSDVSSDCMILEWAEVPTYENSTATNYPPLFHFLAGLPSLFLHGLTGAYAMRIWMALLNATLLASAGAILYSRYKSSFVVLGWTLSITPMVLFLGSTINPSGLAASLGALMWSTGIVLSDKNKDLRARSLSKIFFACSLAFLLVRRDSLLWLLIIGVSLALLHPERFFGDEFRRRMMKLTAGSGLLGLVAFLWIAPSWSTFTAGNNGRNRWTSIPNDTYTYIKQAVGWFGWLDTPLSEALMMVALLTLGTFLLLGIFTSSGANFRTLIFLGLALFLVPLVFAEFRYPYFQGRYYLPLSIGVFYLAGRSFSESELSKWLERRFVGVLGLAWIGVHLWSLLVNYRRYA
tara:strand:+ start:251 stop:1486 length:1236 start_codon:yes stop_codon:yes gene_type:complete